MSESENTPKAKRPPPRSAWKPGQSGNPGGRPAVLKDIRAAAQQEGEACIRALVAIRDNPSSPEAARVAAIRELLDRGFGKPTQHTEITGADGGPIQTQAVQDDRPPIETFLAEFGERKEETKH